MELPQGQCRVFSQTEEQYRDALDCLRERYDHPRQIHLAHVRKLVETRNLKDSTGDEIRQLYDTFPQHLRALKAMKQEPSNSFITSLLEMKLDTNTSYEWQKASPDPTKIPD